MNNFANYVKNGIKDRLSNSFVSSFFISWFLINYKVIITVFGPINEGGNWIDKINYIDIILWNGGDFWLYTLIYPLISALIWFYFVSNIVWKLSIWDKKRNNFHELIGLKVDRKKVISRDDEIKLRKHIRDEWIRIADESEKNDKAIQDVVEKNRYLLTMMTGLQDQLSNKENSNVEIAQKLLESEKLSNLRDDEISKLRRELNPPNLYLATDSLIDDNLQIKYLEDIGFIESNENKSYYLVANKNKNVKLPVVIKCYVFRPMSHEVILFNNSIINDYSLVLIFEVSKNYSLTQNLLYIGSLKDICDRYSINLNLAINDLLELGLIDIADRDIFNKGELPAKINERIKSSCNLFYRLGFYIQEERVSHLQKAKKSNEVV